MWSTVLDSVVFCYLKSLQNAAFCLFECTYVFFPQLNNECPTFISDCHILLLNYSMAYWCTTIGYFCCGCTMVCVGRLLMADNIISFNSYPNGETSKCLVDGKSLLHLSTILRACLNLWWIFLLGSLQFDWLIFLFHFIEMFLLSSRKAYKA